MNTNHAPAGLARYDPVAQALHWLTALLVLFAFMMSIGGPETRVYSPANDFNRRLHEFLGIVVFALTLARMCRRMVVPPPKAPAMPGWLELGARFGHWAIYALLVLVPVTAILGAWLEGHPLTLLGFGKIQPGFAPARPTGIVLSSVHGWLGDLLMWLAGVHAAAALYHHFWRRDTVLLSMLPVAMRLSQRTLARVKGGRSGIDQSW